VKLRQLAPTWCKAFDQWHRLNAHEREAIKYDLRLQTRCVVAEAWGWKDVYALNQPQWCGECDWFGFSFLCCVNGPDNMLDKELLETKGREFSRHWFRFHTEKEVKKCPTSIIKKKKKKNIKKH
jgi:hypothetical protein